MMVELQHRTIATPALTDFVASSPQLTPNDFDRQDFQSVKQTIKSDLNQDQGGLCVYCEKWLAADDGQVEHIKPKSNNTHASLCFVYTNLAHSCINSKTCGQKKKGGILPIEPKPGCNSEWALALDGTIGVVAGLSRQRNHAVTQTNEMLGLNQDSALVADRKSWLENMLEVLKVTPGDVASYLQSVPYCHILATVL